MNTKTFSLILLLSAWALIFSFKVNSAPDNASKLSASKKHVIDHWTAARRHQATPRDLVIDRSGNAFLKGQKGQLIPYGLSKNDAELNRKPGSEPKDTTPPTFNNIAPTEDEVIGDSYTFSADINDESGIRSAKVIIRYPDGSQTQSFAANQTSGNTWSVTIQGFTDDVWSWKMEAKDGASGKGNTGIFEQWVDFTVDTSQEPVDPEPDDDNIVTNAPWNIGGSIQDAAGRIYFEMPDNRRMRRWSGYVCSGTVTYDDVLERSIIITAAHCVYDDVNKAFARNVLFIPSQDETTGSATDLNCNNDPIGCWAPSFGVVDSNWTSRTFPDNIPWDYAFYVVADTGSHQPGFIESSEILDEAVDGFNVSFNNPVYGEFTHALGYSYSDDPNFMYCAEALSTEGSDNWWLEHCELSGGSSGGPWIQLMDEDTGKGPIISINSWGYTTSPGMAGPILFNTSAECVFAEAKIAETPKSSRDGDAGVAANCP